MKRLSVVWVILFMSMGWILPAVSRVRAQSVPIINPKVLEAPGPIPDPAKVTPQVASMAPWSFAVNLANAAYQIITGETGISFQNQYTIKTINAGDDGFEIEQEVTNLTPKSLQDNFLKLVTYAQHMTANHVQCFYDEDGGNDHRPVRKIFKPIAIAWNKVRAVVVLAAYMTPFKLPIEGLNLFMEEIDESVTPDNGLSCGTQTTNLKHIGLFDMGDTDQEYDETKNVQITADEFCPGKLAQYLACLAQPQPSPVPGKPRKPKNCDLICSGSAHTIYSVNIPAAKTRVNPKTGRGEDNLCTGYTCAYLSKAINDSPELQFTHGTNTQDHVVQFAFINTETTSDKAAYYGEYSRRQAMNAKRCSNTSREAPGFDVEKCTFPPGTPPAQPESCEADTYDDVLQKLPGAINRTCNSYASHLPISIDQCKGMMNEIFNIEIRNDPEWSGSNYRCEHRSDSTAAGPFQIIDETYRIVTCDNERMQDDLKACKTGDQLTRCDTNDAAELAMRVILHYSNCKNVGTIGSTAELYTAVCNYGTGTQQLPWLNGQTYCEHVFQVAGIPIP